MNVCDYVWNLATCNCGNRQYLARIMDDSAIICDEVIEPYEKDGDTEAKSNDEAKVYDEANFMKKAICETQSFYI